MGGFQGLGVKDLVFPADRIPCPWFPVPPPNSRPLVSASFPSPGALLTANPSCCAPCPLRHAGQPYLSISVLGSLETKVVTKSSIDNEEAGFHPHLCRPQPSCHQDSLPSS